LVITLFAVWFSWAWFSAIKEANERIERKRTERSR
jgi:hypothetical protein